MNYHSIPLTCCLRVCGPARIPLESSASMHVAAQGDRACAQGDSPSCASSLVCRAKELAWLASPPQAQLARLAQLAGPAGSAGWLAP